MLDEVPGFRVPQDIAVTGYDNNHFASESAIPISTVSQPGEEMGSAAAELLLDRIANPDAPRRTVVLEPHLIPRRSTLGDIWTRDPAVSRRGKQKPPLHRGFHAVAGAGLEPATSRL